MRDLIATPLDDLKKRGGVKFGRRPELTVQQITHARKLIDAGEPRGRGRVVQHGSLDALPSAFNAVKASWRQQVSQEVYNVWSIVVQVVGAIISVGVGLVVLWYTVETKRLRLATDQQVKLLRSQGKAGATPFIILRSLAFGTWEEPLS